jgi:HD-GYP domain-containing protein (c-di-GMP phosphodiesterase class II)
LYYKTIEVVWNEMGQAVKVTGGPLSFIHHIYLGILIVCMAALFAVSMFRRGTYSKRNLAIYMLMPIGAFFVYFIENALSADYSMLPVLYTIADVIIVLRYDNAHMDDISTMVAERHEGNETHGYVAIGLDRRFLSCNEKSYDFMPFLKDQRVNEKPSGDEESIKNINRLIDSFENDDSFNSIKLKDGNKTYLCEISYFSIRGQGKRQGYLLDISDFTEEQRAYDIVESFNENLNAEVAEKTENIRNMQRKIVLGMSNMIENRDNNTGGHVKRTSDIIHILVDEIIKQGKMDISSQMAEDIVRAAPTHDLGKLTIDNNILNKPGRFTDEEYEIMKTHSTKSGEMVMILLDGVEEDRFVKVAFNVARYHHERWDGRGYPEGLVGTMIPFEARIMAVADVYDALVSKRVYKEPMSFEKSASIMCENMGTQFDPNMKSVFLGCREQLEEYYIRNDR